MEKIDQSLAQAIEAAAGTKQSFPVLIICGESCDAVLGKLRELGVAPQTVMAELNIVTAHVSASVIAEIGAMTSVEKIEFDSEASIN